MEKMLSEFWQKLCWIIIRDLEDQEVNEHPGEWYMAECALDDIRGLQQGRVYLGRILYTGGFDVKTNGESIHRFTREFKNFQRVRIL